MTFEEFSRIMPRRLEMNVNNVNVVCVLSYANESGEFNYGILYKRRIVDGEINTATMLIEVREFSNINLKSFYESVEPFFRVGESDEDY